MLEDHQRATQIPNDPGVAWHHFLVGRFIGLLADRKTALALTIQTVEQRSEIHAVLVGLIELSVGRALPVVTEFTGELNLESREISVHQSSSDRHYSGHFSENGRVIILRGNGQSKPIYLVHEDTLSQFL